MVDLSTTPWPWRRAGDWPAASARTPAADLAIDPAIDQDGLAAPTHARPTALAWFGSFATGCVLGIVFMTSEVLSWYRIQEMFRFQSVHMYGVIGVAVGGRQPDALASGVQHREDDLGCRPAAGTSRCAHRVRGSHHRAAPSPDAPQHAVLARRHGLRLGFRPARRVSWCRGPIFTLIGAGHSVYVGPLAAAVAGTYLYGLVRERLPHRSAHGAGAEDPTASHHAPSGTRLPSTVHRLPGREDRKDRGRRREREFRPSGQYAVTE